MNELSHFFNIRVEIANLNSNSYHSIKTKVAHFTGESEFFLGARILSFVLNYTGHEKFNNNIISMASEVYQRTGQLNSYDPRNHKEFGYVYIEDNFSHDEIKKLTRINYPEFTIIGFAALNTFNKQKQIIAKYPYKAKFVNLEFDCVKELSRISENLSITISDMEFFISGSEGNTLTGQLECIS